MMFPPPFFGSMVPPPMPSQDFSGLTVEELQKMEGDERQHVEARIQCLQNIQTLLDAAVFQMQQYTQLIATCRIRGGKGGGPISTASTRPVISKKQESPLTDTNSDGDLSNVEGATGYTAPSDVRERLAREPESDPVDERELDEIERLRRRRLQKFSEASGGENK